MRKSLRQATQRKQKRSGMPEPHTRPLGEARKRRNQLEAIWESFPESLIACDRNQKIIRINAAARKLFEVVSEAQCEGRDYQQFLTSYLRSDEQPPFVSREQWLMNLALVRETGAYSPAQMLLLHPPSGCKSPVTVRTFPVSIQEPGTEEIVSAFQELTSYDQEVTHLQRVQESMLDLLTAITQIPEQIDHVFPDETFFLSSPVLFVAQQVVDVIRSVLNCQHVIMLAFGHRTGHLYFVAGSGWTAEQEQYWRDLGGFFHPSEVFGDATYALLDANQEVVLAMDQLPTITRLGKQLPVPAHLRSSSPGSETFLFLPSFVSGAAVGWVSGCYQSEFGGSLHTRGDHAGKSRHCADHAGH